MEARQPVAEASQVERVLAQSRPALHRAGRHDGRRQDRIGRRLANVLHLPFVDADAEIEKAANLTIAEIFAHYGEPHFREGERRVVARLLAERPGRSRNRRRRLHERGDAAALPRARRDDLAEGGRLRASRSRAQEGQPPAPRSARPGERHAAAARRARAVLRAGRHLDRARAKARTRRWCRRFLLRSRPARRKTPHEPRQACATRRKAGAAASRLEAEPETVRVDLGERSYDVRVGPGMMDLEARPRGPARPSRRDRGRRVHPRDASATS